MPHKKGYFLWMSWINYIHPSIFWSADPHEGLSQLSSVSRWGTPWTDCQPIAVNYVSWLLFFFFIFGVKRKKRNGQFFQNPYPQITTNSGMTPNNIQLAYLKCLHEIYADIYLTYFCAVQKKKKKKAAVNIPCIPVSLAPMRKNNLK